MQTNTFNFTNPLNYALTDIKVVNGIASLIENTPGAPKNKTSNFGTLSDYVYNAGLVQIASNQANLLDQRPAGATFFVQPNASFNANWGNGVLTGTPNGSATIVGPLMSLIGVNTWVSWSPTGNADFTQTGCIRLTYTPNYSGAPASDQVLFSISQALGNDNNYIQIEHFTDGHIYWEIYSSTGVAISQANFNWIPVSGTAYEIELDFDITAGAARFFLNGVQQGATQVGTGVRTNSVGFFNIGREHTNANHTPDFFMSNLILFSTVQHTGNYTPGAAIPPAIYSLANPTIGFTGQAILADPLLGAVTSITATITAAGGDAVQFAVSLDGGITFQYWNGAAWVASNETFAESSTLAAINANLASLSYAAGNFQLLALMHSSAGNTTPVLQNVVVNYYDFVFGSGSIQALNPIDVQSLFSFLSSFTQAGSDTVTFALQVNGVLQYWNGAAWVASNGTLAQTNSMSQIQANMESLLTVNSAVAPYVFLNSGTGSTSPTITNIVIVYVFGAIEPTAPQTCIVYGFLRDVVGNPLPGVTVTFSLVPAIPNGYMEAANHVLFPTSVSTTTDANGYFEQPVVSTSQFEDNNTTSVQVAFTMGSSKESVGPTNQPLTLNVPLQGSVNITTLLCA